MTYEDNKSEDAKYIFEKAYDHVMAANTSDSSSASSAISYMISTAMVGSALGEDEKIETLVDKANELDTTYNLGQMALTAAGYTGDLSKYASNADSIAVLSALNGELQSVLDLINGDGIVRKYTATYTKNLNDSALYDGVIAAMFIENRDDEAIELLYEYRPFKDFELNDDNTTRLGNQIFRMYVPGKLSSTLDNARILKAYDKDVMARYLEALVTDMQERPWNLDDLSISKYVLNYSYGLPVIMKHYKEVGNTTKMNETITLALSVIDGMTTASYKMEGNYGSYADGK